MKREDDFLEKLLNKPESQRRLMALAVSLCFTFLVFSFWFLNFRSNLNSEMVQSEERNLISPLASLRKGFGSFWSSTVKEFSVFREKIDSSLNEVIIIDNVGSGEPMGEFLP